MDTLIESLVTSAVSKVPADIRQAEASSLRASMAKARAMLGPDTDWTEHVLRRMASQYTTWQGQNYTHRAGKR